MSPNRYLLVYLFALIAFVTTAQQQGYIIIDSTYTTGVIFEQGLKTGHREVKFAKSPTSQTTTYYPATVKEYGYSAKTFVSREILTGSESTPYFLRVIAKGKTQLYVLKLEGEKRYFLEDTSGMVELKKANNEYQQTISSRSITCATAKRYAPYIGFSEKALRRYVTNYNTCYEAGPWPFARIGIVGGYAKTNMDVIDVFGDLVSLTESSPFAGLQADLPIGTKPNWFFNIQAVFQKSDFQRHMEKRISAGLYHEFDYSVKTSTFSMPMVVKYSIPAKNLRCFIAAGTSINYHFKSESEMVEDLGGGLENVSNMDLVKKTQVHGILGAGLEYFVNPKNGVGLEVRYNKGGSMGEGAQKVTATQVLLSFYF